MDLVTAVAQIRSLAWEHVCSTGRDPPPPKKKVWGKKEKYNGIYKGGHLVYLGEEKPKAKRGKVICLGSQRSIVSMEEASYAFD